MDWQAIQAEHAGRSRLFDLIQV